MGEGKGELGSCREDISDEMRTRQMGHLLGSELLAFEGGGEHTRLGEVRLKRATKRMAEVGNRVVERRGRRSDELSFAPHNDSPAKIPLSSWTQSSTDLLVR